MKRYIAVILAYSLNSIKVSIQSRAGAIAFLTGKMLRFGLSALFLYFLMQQTKFLAGYTLEQTFLFFLTFNIIDSISQQLYREVYRFRPHIVSGDFDMILVKPIHPFVRVLVGGVDILDTIPTLLYIGGAAFIIQRIGMLSPEQILWYILLVINGLVIATAFHILVLAMGIISTEVDHTIMIYRDITRMGYFPIDIYEEPVRSILTFILPIGIMMSFPVKALLGMLAPQWILVAFLFSAGSLVISLRLWRAAMAKYQSASS
ncbi:MAG: ABC-2 family transporter protein [Patescibacteria group bacterium]|nr:ABC-2 family transporter protein [Patescibacteria group bacterium]